MNCEQMQQALQMQQMQQMQQMKQMQLMMQQMKQHNISNMIEPSKINSAPIIPEKTNSPHHLNSDVSPMDDQKLLSLQQNKQLEERIYNSLLYKSNLCEQLFLQKMKTVSDREKFIFKMQRWSEQVDQARRSTQWLTQYNESDGANISDNNATHWLPIGSYIQSNKTKTYYLNLGIEKKTLQGCVYIGHEYSDSFLNESIDPTNNKQNYWRLLNIYGPKPTLAIKYYDKHCCDLGITLDGEPVQEKASTEIKLTKLIYKNAKKYEPLFPWLQKPCKNIIRLIENWKDVDRHCYYMITEYANCGELLVFIDSYHDIIYKDKKVNIYHLNQIQNDTIRETQIETYKNSLTVSNDGFNAYIEFIRFIFQQMVQSIYILHSQGVAHLDISCENLVLHFDETGQLLVKLIDFGRATKFENNNSENQKYDYEYEKYDFNVSTYPGKCRYMSPESALFLKYKHAEKYDASKEDIYALGIVLFCMLTCVIPYDCPFYIDKNHCLNGNPQYKLDRLNTCNGIVFKDTKCDKIFFEDELDSNFELLHSQENGLFDLLKKDALIDYVSKDSLNLLQKIITTENKRLSLKELIDHPFVKTPPDPRLLSAMIHHVAHYKQLEYADQQQEVDQNVNQIVQLFQDRLVIQTQKILALNTQKNSPPTETPSQSTLGSVECASHHSFGSVDLIAASPPPQINYSFSFSPNMSFSASPEPVQSFQL
eukprot:300283_1